VNREGVVVLSFHDLGLRGEELALSYLSGLGYHLLVKNYRCRIGEVDLIMEDGPVLVFVEVKARRSTLYGLPQEAVGRVKQAKIRRLAQHYLVTRRMKERQLRFDVVAILFDNEGRYQVEHLKGVF
jgi:putative endonuclease